MKVEFYGFGEDIVVMGGGAKGQRKTDRRFSGGTDGAPTLSDLGLSKKESSEAQLLARSAGIVKRHYADVVTAAAAREYWSITPIARGSSKVVQMA